MTLADLLTIFIAGGICWQIAIEVRRIVRKGGWRYLFRCLRQLAVPAAIFTLAILILTLAASVKV